MTNITDFQQNVDLSWGSFCSRCGKPMQGEFPRTCADHHTTFGHDREGVVVMQPVAMAFRQTGLLLVRRNIQPFMGQWAMVSGYKDRGMTFEQIIRSEIKDESGLEYPDQARFDYLEDYIVPAADPETDGRNYHITVFTAPKIGIEQIKWDHTHPEVSEIGLAVYDRKALREYKHNMAADIGFKNHRRLATDYLKALHSPGMDLVRRGASLLGFYTDYARLCA